MFSSHFTYLPVRILLIKEIRRANLITEKYQKYILSCGFHALFLCHVIILKTNAFESKLSCGCCFFFPPVYRYPFPRVFNQCNQAELKRYLSSGGGKCLFNLPNTRVMYGGQRCGNGYLEEGEECDCGEVEVRVLPALFSLCLFGFLSVLSIFASSCVIGMFQSVL